MWWASSNQWAPSQKKDRCPPGRGESASRSSGSGCNITSSRRLQPAGPRADLGLASLYSYVSPLLKTPPLSLSVSVCLSVSLSTHTHTTVILKVDTEVGGRNELLLGSWALGWSLFRPLVQIPLGNSYKSKCMQNYQSYKLTELLSLSI